MFHWSKSLILQDFPGGPVVKYPLPIAGDAGWIPGQGNKIPRATGQLSLRATTTETHADRKSTRLNSSH